MQGRVRYFIAINIMFYGFSLMVMGVYALCWKQIIKKLPLMIAYANKAVVVLGGLLWGCIFLERL